MTTSAIPAVDLAPILGGEFTGSSARAVVEGLRHACANIGFVIVRGHGVHADLVADAAIAAQSFFSLPDDEKIVATPRPWNQASRNTYRGYFPSSVNGKEGLDVGDPLLAESMTELTSRPYYETNCLPESLPDTWLATVERYFASLSSLGQLLMQALTVGLGGSASRAASAFERPRSLSTLRFNYYPGGREPVEISREDGEHLSCETHIDSGFLTILHQDRVAGLQVRGRDRRWHDVETDPTAFVVNTGLALERASGGSLTATQHRVSLCRDERYSIPFFLEPSYDFAVGPASLGLKSTTSDSGAVSYEELLRESLAKFAEYDRRDAEHGAG